MGQLMTVARRVAQADIGLGTETHIQFIGRLLRTGGLIRPGAGGRGAPHLDDFELAALLLGTVLPVPSNKLASTVRDLLDQRAGGNGELRAILVKLFKDVRKTPFACPEFSVVIDVDHPHAVYTSSTGNDYVYGAAFPAAITRTVRIDHRAFWWFATA